MTSLPVVGYIIQDAQAGFPRKSIWDGRAKEGEYHLPYFWQDSRGKEIDCLLVDSEKIVPVEIKSGKTISNSYFENLEYWHQLAAVPKEQGYVVYGGDLSLQTSAGSFIGWRELNHIPR
jgi:hypothetical protein